MQRKARQLFLTTAFAALMLATPAAAQDATPAQQARDGTQNPRGETGDSTLSAAEREVRNSTQALAPIVVTARRIEESLQDVPIAVTAISPDEIDARSMQSTMDLDAFVPNLVATPGAQGGGAAQYAIRGASQVDFIATLDPAVGVYLDGVYLGRISGSALDLVEVERIEVLRGPQGTLFGRNTIGGAINVVTAKPERDFGGWAKLIVGSRGRFDAQANVNVPIINDKLAASFGFLSRNQDGWMRSFVDDHVLGDRERIAARGTLHWTPTPDLEVVVNADWMTEDGTADPHQLIAAEPALGGRPEFVVSDPSVTWVGFRPGNDLEVSGASLHATWDLGGVSLRSISAVRQLDHITGLDFDGGPFIEIDQLVTTGQKQISQELQAFGEGFGGKMNWLLGLYYFKEDVDQVVNVAIYDFAVQQANIMTNRSMAAFAHLDYEILPRLSLSGGVRINSEKKEHFFDHRLQIPIADPFFPPKNPAVDVPLFSPQELEETWYPFTWRGALEYRWNPEVLTYASISKGFRAGGFNGRPVGIGELLSYDPETLVSYEIGAKTEWFAKRLRLNTAAFYSDYKDIQATIVTTGAGGAPIIVTQNAAAAEMYGFEIEALARPTPALRIDAGIGFLENNYKRLDPGVQLSLDAELAMAPKWTMSLGVEYEHALPRLGSLTLRTDYSYKSSFFFFPQNNPLDLQEGYEIVNLRATYRPENERWALSFFGLNIFDEDYALFLEDVRTSFGPALRWPAPPAEWGAELRVSF